MTDAARPANGNTRIQTVAALIGSAVIVFGAFYWVGLIASQVQNNQHDLGDLAGRIAAVETENRELQIAITSLRSSQIEVETQFCSTGNVIDLMHANDMRVEALLWQKAYPGTTIPTDNAFYPTLCRTIPGGSGQ